MATDAKATHKMLVRITPAQRERLEQIAKEHDRSVAWVVRKLIENHKDGDRL